MCECFLIERKFHTTKKNRIFFVDLVIFLLLKIYYNVLNVKNYCVSDHKMRESMNLLIFYLLWKNTKISLVTTKAFNIYPLARIFINYYYFFVNAYFMYDTYIYKIIIVRNANQYTKLICLSFKTYLQIVFYLHRTRHFYVVFLYFKTRKNKYVCKMFIRTKSVNIL